MLLLADTHGRTWTYTGCVVEWILELCRTESQALRKKRLEKGRAHKCRSTEWKEPVVSLTFRPPTITPPVTKYILLLT